VKGASILLAREAMPGGYDDDDDDGGSPAPPPVTKSSTSPVAQNHTVSTGDPD
jgi:hypothetical protein